MLATKQSILSLTTTAASILSKPREKIKTYLSISELRHCLSERDSGERDGNDGRTHVEVDVWYYYYYYLMILRFGLLGMWTIDGMRRMKRQEEAASVDGL